MKEMPFELEAPEGAPGPLAPAAGTTADQATAAGTRLARRHARWEALAALERKLERGGPRALDLEEVDALGRLYRATAADLAQARALGLAPATLERLNALVARVHGWLYRGRPHRVRQGLLFVLVDLPAHFRRTARFTFAAFVLFCVPFVITWLAVSDDPTLTYSLLSPELRANADAFERAPTGGRGGGVALMTSSFYFTNNTSVAFRAFAGGMTAGLFTAWVLFSNGVQLGATAALVSYLESDANFWAFVAPHGTIELLAIFLAGGAGLKIGLAILRPGDRSRRTALEEEGRVGVRMALGAAVLLFGAGVIEGFVSPSGLSNETKYLLGAIDAGALFAWLLAGDRLGRRLLGGREEAG